MRAVAASALAVVLSASAIAQPLTFSPARLVRGDLPAVPTANVAGGGEVLIEAIVDRSGALTRPVMLRSSPPFSASVLDAIGRWTFVPAQGTADDGTVGPVESAVLVAAVYRPPTPLSAPTLGDPPKDLANATANVPYPLSIVPPPYPPQALGASVVLFEVLLDESGQTKSVRAVGSEPGFDEAARDALLQWKFRPGAYRGRAAQSTAYVLFGFSPPVISSVR